MIIDGRPFFFFCCGPLALALPVPGCSCAWWEASPGVFVLLGCGWVCVLSPGRVRPAGRCATAESKLNRVPPRIRIRSCLPLPTPHPSRLPACLPACPRPSSLHPCSAYHFQLVVHRRTLRLALTSSPYHHHRLLPTSSISTSTNSLPFEVTSSPPPPHCQLLLHHNPSNRGPFLP